MISRNLYSHFYVKISPNTVKFIVEIFLAEIRDHAIEETKEFVSKNKKIFFMLEGKRPNKNDHMSWIFIDTLTDKILQMVYLISTNLKKLSEILIKVQEKYGVSIKAVISDYQSSINKAGKETLPRILHQYCR